MLTASLEYHDFDYDGNGWCILQECQKMADDEGWAYVGRNRFWVMVRYDNEYYPFGRHKTFDKAYSEMENIIKNESQ